MRNKILECDFCDKTFIDRVGLMRHLIEHEKTKTVIPKKERRPIEFAKSEYVENTGFERAIVEKNSSDILFLKKAIGKIENRLAEIEKNFLHKSGKYVLTRDQQNKAHALIRLLAKNMGEAEDKVKTLTKKLCFDGKEKSLSSMTKEEAHKYIDYVLCQLIENNESISENDMMFYEKTNFFVSRMVKNCKCIICGKEGKVSKFNNKQFSLCLGHVNEWKEREDKKEFISKYIFNDYFYGVLNEKNIAS